ncbi:hypothetical protein O181_064256 [Austropuccinia psidii MF-1]|uniref:Uncharacterized protein n=1 Tax=Austropuccinia psidii MF-1 TaxID=1389203 RepID=A0A9Q3ETB7_9BASI|nr:hypothetical protein [Austropuccinia psidii MF-1]
MFVGELGNIGREAKALQGRLDILNEKKRNLENYSEREGILKFEEMYETLHKVCNDIFRHMQGRVEAIFDLGTSSMRTERTLKAPESIEMTTQPPKTEVSQTRPVGREEPPAASSSSGTSSGKGEKLLTDLVGILHNFRPPREMQESPLERNEVRGKLALEMCIFQAMGSMYSSQLVSKDVLRSAIFSSPTSAKFNLQLIADHLQHLYSNGDLDIWSSHHTLIPEFDFIMTEWKTAHLHNLLKTLEDDEKAHLVYLLLVGLLHQRLQPTKFGYDAPKTNFIFDNVVKHHLFEPPLGVLATSGPSVAEGPHEELALDVIKNMIEFLRTYDLETHIPQFPQNFYQSSFLLNYCLMEFAQKYKTSAESHFFLSKLDKDSILKEQYELVGIGRKLQQYINKFLDKRYLLSFPEGQTSVVSMEVSKQSLEEFHEILKNLSDEYKERKFKLLQEPTAQQWITKNKVITYFNHISDTKLAVIFSAFQRNLWLSRRSHASKIAGFPVSFCSIFQ